jgi:predicted acylesterase/phospholipase RssA
MQSVAFRRCIGVFEGGGVRGAAFAGVYSAAVDAGIDFAGVTGVSAGSIAAAFVAAGMKSENVTVKLKAEFKHLLASSEPPQGVWDRRKQWAASWFGETATTVAQWQYSLGVHSSVAIENWMNETLKLALGAKNRTVYFEDLPKPLAIVAADVSSRGPKIFSRGATPNTSVGFAVRASCSIPFFFQPVPGEGNLLVDGGVVSNLPIFLVKELNLDSRLPVLCFRLSGDRQPSDPKELRGLGFAREVIETAINGVTQIHLNFGRAQQVIEINTGSIKSTDFHITQEQTDWLYNQGKRAVNEFVENEQVRMAGVTTSPSERVVRGYREGLLERTAELISTSVKNVLIVAGDMSWLRDLHVSLLSTVLDGRQLTIVCEESNSSEYHKAFKAAVALGVEVVELTSPTGVRGSIVDPWTDIAKMLLIEKLPQTHGRVYTKPADSQLIEFVVAQIEVAKGQGVRHSTPAKPTLASIPDDEIVNALNSHVFQYRNKRITVEEVPVASLKPLAKCLESFKLRRAEEMDQLLVKCGINGAARYRGSPWVIGLPVVEQLKNGNRIVIDGTHRVYRAMRSARVENLRVALIENDVANLPAVPFDNWNHIRVQPEKIDRPERYEHYDDDNFRPIRAAYDALAK